MSYVKTQHICAFCTLVIQIGRENLTENDIRKIQIHMRIEHGLRPYHIPA